MLVHSFFDRDNSGTLDKREFVSALRRDAKIPKRDMSDEDLENIFDTVDVDGGGEIDIEEFVAWVERPIPESESDEEEAPPPEPPKALERPELRMMLHRVRQAKQPVPLELFRILKRRIAAAAYTINGLDYDKLFRYAPPSLALSRSPAGGIYLTVLHLVFGHLAGTMIETIVAPWTGTSSAVRCGVTARFDP